MQLKASKETGQEHSQKLKKKKERRPHSVSSEQSKKDFHVLS